MSYVGRVDYKVRKPFVCVGLHLCLSDAHLLLLKYIFSLFCFYNYTYVCVCVCVLCSFSIYEVRLCEVLVFYIFIDQNNDITVAKLKKKLQ